MKTEKDPDWLRHPPKNMTDEQEEEYEKKTQAFMETWHWSESYDLLEEFDKALQEIGYELVVYNSGTDMEAFRIVKLEKA